MEIGGIRKERGESRYESSGVVLKLYKQIKPCDICGDHGVIEAVITCSECKVAREHLYCMRVLMTQAPQFWRCEECDQNMLTSPKTTENEKKTRSLSSLMQQTTFFVEGPKSNSTASKFSFKEKRVDKGRTKYITCDEAVKLSSGSMKLNHTRKDLCCAHGMSKSMSPPRLSQQSTGLKENPLPSIKSPACERKNIKSPQEERNCKPDLQQLVIKQSHVRKGKPVPPFQNRGNAIQSITSSLPSKRTEKTNLEREKKAAKNELLSPKKAADIIRHIEVPQILKNLEKTETIAGCQNIVDNVTVRSSAGKSNLKSGLSVSEMHDPYLPSLNSYWNGCLYLPNGSQKFSDAFKAHLPSRIHYKVYETAKKMPENIYFELVPNDEIRTEIFPADRDDIGLYFFPMFKRSENEISIIDFIWRNNLVMKGNVEGVDLFVLSSRVLPSHAQEFQGNYFLWGVFRPQKTTKKVADPQLLTVAKLEAFDDDDVPPGFKKIHKH
ncbi:hypothetical protein SSX86_007581 [Deinandra increscens subsp. villosa]|uniref:AIPP2-like SPOC-like domain-containing protein n=1 Tax=Deinandra increscens subsp. villosa TaxID=3103831 RepID=A0AAP0H686_9ASTR